MKPLHFIITGLISGSLCWLLLPFFPVESQTDEILVTYLPAMVLAITLLVLGRKLGMIPKKYTTTSISILVVASLLANYFIIEYQLSEPIWWELEFYPPFFFEGEASIYELSALFLLPTPITLAIHSFVVAFAVAFAWNFSAPLHRVLIRTTIYGALFGVLILLMTHLFSTAAMDLINDTLSVADQTSYIEQLDLLASSVSLITLLIWHSMLLLAIYMGIRAPSSSAVISDENQREQAKYRDSQHIASSTNTFKQKEVLIQRLSTSEIIEQFKIRKQKILKLFWALLVAGFVSVSGITYHYKTSTDSAYQSMIDAHRTIVQQHAANHPLYTLWPELKACGDYLRNMTDLMWATEISKATMACETQIMNRLKREQDEWLFTLKSETINLPYYVSGELLVQSNSPNHPFYVLVSALRECNGDLDELTEINKAKDNNEPLTDDQLYFVDRFNKKRARIQKSLDGYTKTLSESSDSMLEKKGVYMGFYGSDYKLFKPPWKPSKETWSYWDDYYADMPDDYDSHYPPRGSFQEALNRSWQYGEVIHPVENPDDPLTYFHDGTLELLTPIIIDGETQAIILTTLESTELNESIADEWQNYRNTIIPVVVILMIIFFWYEHRTLARIPQRVSLKQWKPGMWRPSLLTLYLVDGFRYYHLFNMVFFLVFSVILFFMPAEELWKEELTWDMWLIHIATLMSLPLLFSLFIIPRMLTDYRLFAKGIPVSCKKTGEKMEKMISAYDREYHDRYHYEAHYQGKTYQFSAPASNVDDDSAIALINPKRTNHGLIINNFYESD